MFLFIALNASRIPDLSSMSNFSYVVVKELSKVMLDQRMRGHTARTIGTYEERLGRFINWLAAAGITYVGQITPPHIRSYLNDSAG